MKLVKVVSDKTYLDNKGVEKHYINYYLVLDNGNRLAVKNAIKEQYRLFDMLAEVE